MREFKNLIEVCDASSSRHGSKLAYRYIGRTGPTQSLSFAALREQSIGLAGRLQRVGEPGDRALIICPQRMDYVRALWGCLYSGLVAVPAYAPGNTHHLERLETIVENAEARVLLLSSRQLDRVRKLARARGLWSSLRWVVVDDPDHTSDPDQTWVEPTIEPDDLALLQYTSGSVMAPRGVMISHRNMLANQEMIRAAFGHHRDTISVLWLPLFHDMGLVSLIQGVYAGFSSHLMGPLDFLTRPVRWLETISELRGTATAAPDFAYRRCLETISDAQLERLDLSSLVTVVNGAEPISASKLDAFARRFAACGLRRSALFPAYGLAEATLLVCGRRDLGGPRVSVQPASARPPDSPAIERVACGSPVDGCEVRIVDDRGQSCVEGHVGEIWVRGEHVAAGYWNNPAASAHSFGAHAVDGQGPFLRTGDLGYLDEGELVVAGRLRDLLIVRGANYYPNDIEQTAVAAHAQLGSSSCAAFLDANEQLCLVAEVARDSSDHVAIEVAVVSAVSEVYGLQIARLVLVEPRTLPKTSSGKIQRGRTRRALAEAELEVVYSSVDARARALSETGELRRLLAAADDDEHEEILAGLVLALLAEQLGLPLDRLSRRESVASFGLDSVAWVELADKLALALALELPVQLMRVDVTIDELCTALAELIRAEPRAAFAEATTEDAGAVAPTAAQVALWLMHQREPTASPYNEGVLAQIDRPLDRVALEQSLTLMVARHPALRTTFHEREGQLSQVVAPARAVALRRDEAESAAQALTIAQAVLDTPFELEREAWRVRLVAGPGVCYLALAVHHIVFDMWSFGVFLTELSAIYTALVAGEPAPVPAIGPGEVWLDRARALAEYAGSAGGQRDLDEWGTVLADAPISSRFPYSPPSQRGDPGRQPDDARAARSHHFVVDAVSLETLRGFAQREQLTLFQLLLGGFFVLLSKYTGQDDLVIGTPLLGRDSARSRRELGYFVNLAPVRVQGIGQTDVLGVLTQTKRAVEACQRRSPTPFAKLVEAWGPGGGRDWVQTLFSLLSAQLAGRRELAPFVLGTAGGRLPLGPATLRSTAHNRRETAFDLSCTLMEHDSELHGVIVVRDARYDPALIDDLIVNYRALLIDMVRAPHVPTTSIAALAKSSWPGLRAHLRRPPSPRCLALPRAAGVVEWFRQAASDHGPRLALVSPSASRSYAALAHESDTIARALVERGLSPGDRVALGFAERCAQTVAAVAVLEAGGVFVPLDLGHPSARLEFCLRDSGARWILVDDASLALMRPHAAAVGAVVVCLAALLDTEPDPSVELPAPSHAEAIAYCIYTSGSTGTPKGVSVPHRGLLNLIAWHASTYDLGPDARASLIAGPAFDVAVWEVWPYLCTGGVVIEPPPATKAVAADLACWIRTHRLTHSFVPTALAELLLGASELDLGPLRYLFTAGDRLRVRPPAGASFTVINAYGPTENSVITTAGPVAAVGDGEGPPDIGEPIANQDLYIFDRDGHQVPVGVNGELYIGGPGLARGYHAQPGRTAASFVPNRFATEPGSRLYATGDVVRLASDGRIHFVARNDDQVKIRGHRVELGEIEAWLIQHPGVRQCKVTLQESPAIGKWLAAYVVSAQTLAVDDEVLQRWLSERLPAAMIPRSFRWIDALPLDANGKIDRRQLPPIDGPQSVGSTAAPAEGPIEVAIAELYGELLGVESVGRDDDFFALGGHSLLAGVLVQRIRERLGPNLAMAELFRHPEVRALAAQVRVALDEPGSTLAPTAAEAESSDRAPLSPSQRRLWFLQRLEPQSTDYNMSGSIEVRGALDLAALDLAVTDLVARHGALRTRFPIEAGEPCQQVLPTLTIPVVCVGVDAHDRAARDQAVGETIAAWASEPFCLSDGPLVRVRVVRAATDHAVLFVSIHHIVADGRSLQIMLRELSASYRDAKTRARRPGSELPTQYLNYTLAILGEAHAARRATALDYWRQQLSPLPAKLSIPALAPVVDPDEPGGDELRHALAPELVALVRARARTWKTTEVSIYLATLAALLGDVSGQDRLVIGIAYEGRDLPGLHDAVGCFVNILPVVAEPSAHVDFAALLADLRRSCAEALTHSHASYEEIVHHVRAEHDSAALDLIQVMFDFEQFTPERIVLDGVDAVLLARADTTAKFDLTFRCRVAADEPTIALNYRRRRYGRVVIESLLTAYATLLRQVLAEPDAALSSLRLIDQASMRALVRRGAGRDRALPASPIVSRFEALASAHPQRLALASADGERLSYGSLDAAANRVARVLREAGLGQGQVGAICLPPGLAFVTTALAMIKLGAAYAAIDPQHPQRRRAAIVADCAAPVVVATAADEAPAAAGVCLAWSTISERAATMASDSLAVRREPDDPIYVVYTSGTSGAPKGVVIAERGLANLCQWHAEAYALAERGERVRAGQTAGVGFDASVWELWPYLLTGASVWFAPPPARLSAAPLARWLREAQVTHVFVATPLAVELVGDGWRGTGTLEYLFTGGDRLTRWAVEGATYQLVNHYGPSENTVVATAGLVATSGPRSPAIGRPIDNVQALVLGRSRQILPLGIAGELHLGGRSLLRGYLGDPALTGRKRSVDPRGPAGAWLYPTGDRVCWNEADELEFLGRVDDQLEIRGVRIEPAEIVHSLSALPEVQAAVVKPVAHPTTGLHLAAYLVAQPGATIDPEQVRAALARSLPNVMVPRFVVALDGLPRTRNGKVDFAALPSPSFAESGEAVALATPTQRAVAAIWSSLLGVVVEDAAANFFALGGHSLLAARAVAAIELELGQACSIQTFLANSTLAQLADAIDASAAYLPIPIARRGQTIPLAPVQRRLWLVQQFTPENVDANVVGAIELHGALERSALERALAQLLERHSVLRTRIELVDGQPCQRIVEITEAIDGAALGRISSWEDLRAVTGPALTRELERRVATLARVPFDLERGPLVRVEAATLADDRVALIVAVHHIIVDGWSMAVLLRDLVELYRSARAGRAPTLAALTLRYADYSVWASQQLERREPTLISFWTDYLRDRPAAALLPRRRRPQVAAGTGQTCALAVGEALSERVADCARARGLSRFTLLLTAHLVWLHQLTRTTDLVVGTPVNGRGRPELDALVGFFVNILPVRAQFSRSWSFWQLADHVQGELARTHRHQQLPFDRITEHASVDGTPLCQTMFDLRHEPAAMRERNADADADALEIKVLAEHLDAPLADLAVTLADGERGLTWSCTFRPELFAPALITSWGHSYRALLVAALDDEPRSIGDLPFASAPRPHPPTTVRSQRARAPQTLLSELAREVAIHPSSAAMTTDGQRWSYLELDQASNQIAHFLRAKGVRAGEFVGVEARHDPNIILAILAILKLGAAYVPIDMTQPRARLLALLADAGCARLVTVGDATLAGFEGRALALEARPWAEHPRHGLGVSVGPDYPVYLASTSGTTGAPKSSVLSHRGVTNYIETARERFDVGPDDRVLLFAPLTFDASLEEMFLPLCSGACLHIGPGQAKDSVSALVELCRAVEISVLILPTAYWRLLAAHIDAVGRAALPTVRMVSIGGERAPVSAVSAWLDATAGEIALWNIYGPSECSIGSVVDRLDGSAGVDAKGYIPLRDLVANVELHVLDANLERVPPGVDGEIYVGGEGLAHGYHRRPSLTAERFIPNPFSDRGARLYRTGDLARIDHDGELQFLGRLDFQVKIDGVRVEPGEIEACLDNHPSVAKAVVIARRVGTVDAHLVAYVTQTETETEAATADGLLAHLRELLPAYMVPARIDILAELPLTTNQKIDRAALREREPEARAYTPATTPSEALLLELWRELLPRARFGVTDDIFSLGAGSLLVIQLITRIEARTGVRLSVREVFDHPTIRAMAERVAGQRGVEPRRPIPRISETELPLSGAQLRLWYLQQLDTSSCAYHVPNCLELDGSLSRAALEAAIQRTIADNEALRTVFVVRGDGPVQVVLEHAAVTLTHHDLSGLDSARARATALAGELLERRFALDRGPLCRFDLIRLGPERHVLVTIFHHIVVDGWSIERWNRQLAEAYNTGLDNFDSLDSLDCARVDPSRPRALQYRDFAAWQRRQLDGGERDRQLSYWRGVLAGVLPSLELPTDFARPAEATDRGELRSFELDPDLVARLLALAQGEQVSLFVILLSAYVCLLHRYSSQVDLLVGIPTHGRGRPELDEVIGFFVNTVVLRCRAHGAMSFAALVAEVRDVYLDASDHQDVALEDIAATVDAAQVDGRRALFQTMFSFHEAAQTGAEALSGLQVSDFEVPHRSAKFDLYLATWTRGEGLSGAIEFRTDLFTGETVERMIDHFERLLAGVAADPQAKLAALPLLGAHEHDALTQVHNGPVRSLPDLRAHQLFERQAADTPERVAVTCGGRALSYAQLNRRANLVAHELVERGAGPEDRVVLLLARDISYVIGLLACLKAGAAFVPMDPSHPLARRRSIAGQSAARLVLSTPEHRAQADELELGLGAIDLARVLPDPLLGSVPSSDPRGRDLELPLSDRSLAYVIYTSGSTGEPKGVMIEHRGLLNHLLSKVDDLGLTAEDVVAEMAATTFDVSIWQYLAALLVGARTAVIPGDAAWLPRELLTALEREQVTVFESVPSHMNVILDELESRAGSAPAPGLLPQLRTYISNAEALTPELCRRWFACLAHVTLINTYGATECSDDTSHLTIAGPRSLQHPYIPIHGTLANHTTYVLDEWLAPVPLGVPGEIYIGGAGVGRGYIASPVKTALAFRPDPFAEVPGQRLYRTGDIGRSHAGGVLEFLGRADFQVKIRGRRVELGEIEATLGAHDNVREALVSAVDVAQRGLCLLAYVVPVQAPAPTAAALAAFVGARLTSAMIPAAFVFMDAFPLNANGKVDRSRLPALADGELSTRHAYLPPSTATEQALVELWSDLLEVAQVGVLDSFLELGGHSLLVAELMIKVRARFGVDISFKQFFAAPSVRELATAIDEHEQPGRATGELRRYPAKPRYALAPCQIPEWYAYQLDPASPVYNICVADLFFRGALDKPAFLHAWQRLLARHEVLHVRLGYRDGAPFQTTETRVELSAADVFCDRSDLHDDAAVLAEANRLASELGAAPFDFERGPLFRLALVSYAGERHQLIFVVHHIIWDETSLINLTVELSELYNAALDEREPALPALAASYFDYVQWMHELLDHGALEAAKRYWLELYRTVPPPLDLPTDYPRPDVFSHRGDAIETWLPRGCVRKLSTFLKRNEVTLFMVKLAVLAHYVHLLTGQHDFVIGCPIAGRARPEFKPLLGLFATPMPLRCTLSPGMSFRELLDHVVERTVEGFEHFLYPSNQLIEQLRHQKDLSRPKLFSVMFGVQNDKTNVIGELEFRNLELSFEDVANADNKSSRFDLNFVVDQFGSDIKFSCIYNTDLFERQTVSLMLDNLTALLEAVIDQPDLPLHGFGDLSAPGRPLAAFERGQIVAVDDRATIHGAVERQAAATPDHVAVIAGADRCSYTELNRRANRLAHYLDSLGVEPGRAVAVELEPSIDLIVALLAVLKAGCCYVPLMPGHPRQRIEAIVRDADVRAVLTTRSHEARFINVDAELVALDDLTDLLACFVETDLAPVDPAALAYILFTSGTTGQPRGILIEHHGVASMIAAMQDQYELETNDRVLFQTAVTFDVSVQEIFWPLAVGATVVVALGEPGGLIKAPREIAALIDQHAVTVAQFVPVTLEALVVARRKQAVSALPSLRQVVCGGAVLSRSLNEGFRAVFTARLANHYGPTEVTVDATTFDCSEPFIGALTAIGRPIANTRVYILNPEGERVPRGVIGEIYVASPGLARGYVRDQAGTAAAFVELDLDGRRQRLFRTGDLGRFDREGLIYFAGRRDRQVKIRGNRVELDEIVSALTRHPDVAVAAVRAVGGPGAAQRLVAYIEQDPGRNRVLIAGQPRYAFSLAQRPELSDAATDRYLRQRPGFLDGEATVRQLWPRLVSEHPELQLVITDAADVVEVVGHAVPLSLAIDHDDPVAAGRGLGWGQALRRAFAEPAASAREPNALYVFVGATPTSPPDVSAWTALLDRYHALAAGLGFALIIYAHRPLWLAQDGADIDLWRRAATDPSIGDPQLSAQAHLDAQPAGVIFDSLHVEGTGCQWTQWTETEVSRSGPLRLPTTLLAVDVDLETNRWTYSEPCVSWVGRLGPERPGPPLDRARVRAFLMTSLPDYMVPNAVHFLPTLARTDSGKIDERRLPDIDVRASVERRQAETALQQELTALYQEILELPDACGINDDFFVLGGQSLKAVELISEINHRYGSSISLRAFYERPTVEHIEHLLHQTTGR